VRNEVRDLILATADLDNDNEFNQLDRKILSETSMSKLIEWEHGIFKEYQYLSYPEYKKGRLEFLSKCVNKYPNLTPLIDYVENRKINVGCYFGTFNPFHVGHYDILTKANNLFDKVIVVVAQNPDKLPIENENNTYRIENKLKYFEVVRLLDNGTQVSFMNSIKEYSNPTAIKGLRNTKDLEEALDLEYWSKKLGDYNVVYLTCDEKYRQISSKGIRTISTYDANAAKRLIEFDD
jgi:pantetheine-phosphate adenylyltransferase